DACSESEYRNISCNYEICKALSVKHFRKLPICAKYVFHSHDEADIGQKQKQYHHQEIDCTFEQHDDVRIPGQDVYADAAEDAEAVIYVFVQRHRIKGRDADVYSGKVVKQDE
ncbi:MAG: hypothetical protein ACYTDW_15495, partial [Planctomycetota bacterium]